MCLFVEKLLSLKKKVCVSGPKGPQKNRPVMPQHQTTRSLTSSALDKPLFSIDLR